MFRSLPLPRTFDVLMGAGDWERASGLAVCHTSTHLQSVVPVS